MALMAPRGYVRLALPFEARAIAELQVQAWSDPSHPGHRLADQLDIEEVTAIWHRSIVRPPLASYRVLVSVVPAERTAHAPVEKVVGFLAVGPSEDPDATADVGAVVEWAVDSEVRGDGHRERLVQAAVDTMRLDRFTLATWWVPTTDDEVRAALTDSGWGADGAHVELHHPDDDNVKVKLVRLHTDIRDTRDTAAVT